MERGDDDDFANTFKLVYPPIVFDAELLSEGDRELLRPVVMIMYALTMTSERQNFSLVNFDPIKIDRDRREYVLSATVVGSEQIGYDAWYSLLMASPARITSVLVAPFYDAEHDTVEMCVRVSVRSERAPLAASFAVYKAISSRTMLLRLNEVAQASSRITTNVIDDDISQANEQVYAAARDEVRTLVDALRRECRSLVKNSSGYDFGSSFHTNEHPRSGHTIVWTLPQDEVLDIGSLMAVKSKFASFILKLDVGLVHRPAEFAGIGRPVMQVAVTFTVMPTLVTPVFVRDTVTFQYFTDAKAEPWRLCTDTPAVASTFRVDQFAPRPLHAEKQTSLKRRRREGFALDDGSSTVTPDETDREGEIRGRKRFRIDENQPHSRIVDHRNDDDDDDDEDAMNQEDASSSDSRVISEEGVGLELVPYQPTPPGSPRDALSMVTNTWSWLKSAFTF